MRPIAGPGRICRQLSSGGGAGILVAESQPLNAARRLSQLLSDAATGQRVYQVDPRDAVSGDRLYASLPELADEAASCIAGMEQLMREELALLAERLGLGATPLAFSEMLVSYRTWPGSCLTRS